MQQFQDLNDRICLLVHLYENVYEGLLTIVRSTGVTSSTACMARYGVRIELISRSWLSELKDTDHCSCARCDIHVRRRVTTAAAILEAIYKQLSPYDVWCGVPRELLEIVKKSTKPGLNTTAQCKLLRMEQAHNLSIGTSCSTIPITILDTTTIP